MSDTSRQIPHRRKSPVSARRPGTAQASRIKGPSVAASSVDVTAHPARPSHTVLPAASPRIEALRRLVAAGQYQVSPRWLAQKICRAAGVIFDLPAA